MLEITRELVEHYLRAAGWTKDRDDCTAIWTSADHFRSMTDGEVDEPLRHLPRAMCFRLGLCAAAEREREQMNAIHDRDTTSMSRDERIRIDERSRSYQDLLTLAGIDPRAWESARKR